MPRQHDKPRDAVPAAHAAEPGDPTAAAGAPPEPALEALVAERDAALTRAEENLALAQRAQADYANLKRRTAEERLAMLGLANEILLAKVVGLADDFDLAIEHVPDEARDTAWLEGIPHRGTRPAVRPGSPRGPEPRSWHRPARGRDRR